MNVLDVMPKFEEVPDLSQARTIVQLVEQRYERFRQLAEIEERRGGFTRSVADLSTPQGQEIMRILLQRTIEEVGESFEASDPVHQREEVIDAFNFLWAAYLLDPQLFNVESLSEMVVTALVSVTEMGDWVGEGLSYVDLGIVAYHLATRIGDSLRNRPWHQGAQDHYFAGRTEMKDIFVLVMEILLKVFSSAEEFWCYFIAKDRVLQFRIRTLY